MARPEHPDDAVKSAMVITRRQHDALRAAAAREDRSMSWFIRKALDSFFGFDKVVIDPREGEQEMCG